MDGLASLATPVVPSIPKYLSRSALAEEYLSLLNRPVSSQKNAIIKMRLTKKKKKNQGLKRTISQIKQKNIKFQSCLNLK